MAKRLSVIENYFEKGFLSFFPGYTPDERLAAAKRLHADYIRGAVPDLGAIDPARIRVDGSANGADSEKVLFYRDLFNKAVRSIPAEFFPVIRRVCLEDKELKAGKGGGRYARYNEFYAAKKDLCRGLDRLVKFYTENHLKLYFDDISKLPH